MRSARVSIRSKSGTARLTQVTDRLIEQYGFKGLPFFSDIGGLPAVSVNGYTGVGEGGTLPNLKLSQVIQFADGVSIVHGGHSFKTGADVRFIISNAFTPSGTSLRSSPKGAAIPGGWTSTVMATP